jgi:hypothetical protein
VSGTPWYEQEGTQYWLNVQAVFTNRFDPARHQGWGWKITRGMYPEAMPCASAVSTNNGASWYHDNLPTTPGYPREGEMFDLAFELTTTNAPSTNSTWYTGIRFTNIVVQSDLSRAWMWTTGYCGCGKQIIQESTNLLESPSGWVNVQTNPVPRTRNAWRVKPSGTQRYYRVQHKN